MNTQGRHTTGLVLSLLQSFQKIMTCLGSVFSVTAINVLGITLFTVGGASVLFILLLYADTLRHIMKNVPPVVKTHSAFVLSVYPVSDR
jgi:hypothetical protein